MTTAAGGQHGEIQQQTHCWPSPLAERLGASSYPGTMGCKRPYISRASTQEGAGCWAQAWVRGDDQHGSEAAGCAVHRRVCGSLVKDVQPHSSFLVSRKVLMGSLHLIPPTRFASFSLTTVSELDESSSVLCYSQIKQRNSREDEKLLQVVFEG